MSNETETSTKKTRKPYTCSVCGEVGHNARTCGRPAPPPRKTRGQYTCSVCGELGHNSRTCPQRDQKTVEPTVEERIAALREKNNELTEKGLIFGTAETFPGILGS
tara:strand:+ start:184 stop:501 length:318 start_codon:yes stop_codon:yes gene_type:complete